MVRLSGVPASCSFLVLAALAVISCSSSAQGPSADTDQALVSASTSDSAAPLATTTKPTIEPFTDTSGCKNGIFYAATVGDSSDTVLVVHYASWLEQRTRDTEAVAFDFSLPDERLNVVIQRGPGVAGSPFCTDAVPPGIEVVEEIPVTSGTGSMHIAAPEFESNDQFAPQVCVAGSFTLAGGRTADGRAVPDVDIVTDQIGCGYGG